MFRHVTQLRSNIIIAGALIFAALFRFPVPAGALRISFEILFNAAMCIGLTAFIWRINKIIAGFLLLACFSLFFPQYDRASFLSFNMIITGCLWYVIIYYLGKIEILLNALCIIGIANGILLILQYFNIDPVFTSLTPVGDSHTGFMANPNEVSALLAFCAPAFFRKRWFWFMPLILIGIVLAKSAGGFVALMVGLLFFFTCHKPQAKYVFFGLFILAVSSFFITVDAPGVDARLFAWQKGIKLFAQHWIIGSGLGHWKYVFMQIPYNQDGATVYFLRAHNEYLQAIFEMGISSAVIIGWYFIYFLKNYKYATLSATAIVIVGTNAAFNFPFHIGTTAMVAITWMGLFDIEQRESAHNINPRCGGPSVPGLNRNNAIL